MFILNYDLSKYRLLDLFLLGLFSFFWCVVHLDFAMQPEFESSFLIVQDNRFALPLEITFVKILNRTGKSLTELIHKQTLAQRPLTLACIWPHKDSKPEFYEAENFNRYLYTPNMGDPDYDYFNVVKSCTPVGSILSQGWDLAYLVLQEPTVPLLKVLFFIQELKKPHIKEYMSIFFKGHFGTREQKEHAGFALGKLFLSGQNSNIKKDPTKAQEYLTWIIEKGTNENYKKEATNLIRYINNQKLFEPPSGEPHYEHNNL